MKRASGAESQEPGPKRSCMAIGTINNTTSMREGCQPAAGVHVNEASNPVPASEAQGGAALKTALQVQLQVLLDRHLPNGGDPRLQEDPDAVASMIGVDIARMLVLVSPQVASATLNELIKVSVQGLTPLHLDVHVNLQASLAGPPPKAPAPANAPLSSPQQLLHQQQCTAAVQDMVSPAAEACAGGQHPSGAGEVEEDKRAARRKEEEDGMARTDAAAAEGSHEQLPGQQHQQQQNRGQDGEQQQVACERHVPALQLVPTGQQQGKEEEEQGKQALRGDAVDGGGGAALLPQPLMDHHPQLPPQQEGGAAARVAIPIEAQDQHHLHGRALQQQQQQQQQHSTNTIAMLSSLGPGMQRAATSRSQPLLSGTPDQPSADEGADARTAMAAAVMGADIAEVGPDNGADVDGVHMLLGLRGLHQEGTQQQQQQQKPRQHEAEGDQEQRAKPEEAGRLGGRHPVAPPKPLSPLPSVRIVPKSPPAKHPSQHPWHHAPKHPLGLRGKSAASKQKRLTPAKADSTGPPRQHCQQYEATPSSGLSVLPLRLAARVSQRGGDGDGCGSDGILYDDDDDDDDDDEHSHHGGHSAGGVCVVHMWHPCWIPGPQGEVSLREVMRHAPRATRRLQFNHERRDHYYYHLQQQQQGKSRPGYKALQQQHQQQQSKRGGGGKHHQVWGGNRRGGSHGGGNFVTPRHVGSRLAALAGNSSGGSGSRGAHGATAADDDPQESTAVRLRSQLSKSPKAPVADGGHGGGSSSRRGAHAGTSTALHWAVAAEVERDMRRAVDVVQY